MKSNFFRLLFLWLALPVLTHKARAYNVLGAAMATVDLKNFAPDVSKTEGYVKFLGFRSANSVLFAVQTNRSADVGRIVRWNVLNQGVQQQLICSKWLSLESLVLSEQGNVMTTHNRLIYGFEDSKAALTTILDSSNFNPVRTQRVPANEDITGYLFLPNDASHVLIQAGTFVPLLGTNDSTLGKDRFDWFNFRTGKVDKRLFYKHAHAANKMLSSPDNKFLLPFFYSDKVSSTGENDYFPDLMERDAIVDVVSSNTGKILWHLEGTDQQPVGDPLFFISPTRFISSDTVFNITTKTARHWNAVTLKRKCLAAVPNHPNYALFLTPGGLQLRNWQKDKLLVSWPNIKKPGRILFSPDLKMFSFKRSSIIQFWRFDPKWLR